MRVHSQYTAFYCFGLYIPNIHYYCVIPNNYSVYLKVLNSSYVCSSFPHSQASLIILLSAQWRLLQYVIL